MVKLNFLIVIIKNIEQTITIAKHISASISSNQKVGGITFLDIDVLSTVNLVLQIFVDKIDLTTMLTKVFSS